jgi:hypothetical protein
MNYLRVLDAVAVVLHFRLFDELQRLVIARVADGKPSKP